LKGAQEYIQEYVRGMKVDNDNRLTLVKVATSTREIAQLYQATTGSVNNSATISCSDIAYPTGLSASYVATPSEEHMTATKRMYAYVKRTVVRRRLRFISTEDQQREECGNKKNGVCCKIEKLSACTKSQDAMPHLLAKDVPCAPKSDASWSVRMPETWKICP
jgi:hypothetical protein